MNWAGGDPLLNTFIGYPEGELARLIFHELAHQVVYAKDDTMFNESFATAVERMGSQRWLDSEAAHGNGKQPGLRPVRRPAPAVPRAGAGHAPGAGRYLWGKARDRRRKSRAAALKARRSSVFATATPPQGFVGRLRGLRPLGGARQQRGLRRAGRL
jgi:hypothetical protein